MAHSKSALKRNRQNIANRGRNMAVRSRMKTYVKNAMEAIETKDAAKAKSALSEALTEIDRAASKGVIHRNSAARKKSTLQRAYGQLA